MELNYLKEFIELVRIGNFQRTADHLFMSESSLSKHIMRLEKELGFLLFDRSGRKAVLSDFGHAFLPYAIELNDCRQRYIVDLINRVDPKEREITVGFASAEFIDEIATLVTMFQKENPNCAIKISQDSFDEIKEKLRQNMYGLIFLSTALEAIEDDFIVLDSQIIDDVVVVMPGKHPLAHEKIVPIEKLKRETFIQVKGTYAYSLAMQICHNAGFEPIDQFSVKKTEIVMKLIAKGLGVTITRHNIANRFQTGDVAIVPIEPGLELHTVILYSKNHKPLPEEQWVMHYFQKKWSPK